MEQSSRPCSSGIRATWTFAMNLHWFLQTSQPGERAYSNLYPTLARSNEKMKTCCRSLIQKAWFPFIRQESEVIHQDYETRPNQSASNKWADNQKMNIVEIINSTTPNTRIMIYYKRSSLQMIIIIVIIRNKIANVGYVVIEIKRLIT